MTPALCASLRSAAASISLHAVRRLGSAHAIRCRARVRQLRAPARRRVRHGWLERAAFCGVSFGGFIALRYAATRSPTRRRADSGVVARAGLAAERRNRSVGSSVPGCRRPPSSPPHRSRLWPEVCATHPDLARGRLRFFARQGLRAAASPMIPSLMARGFVRQQRLDFGADCDRISTCRRWSSPAKTISIESCRRQ